MVYQYNKNEIKENLTLEQIEELLTDWDAEPQRTGDIIVARTVCHNNCGCGTHKLYYYPNTTLFKCYTDCGESFDVFELTRKVLSRENPKPREDSEWNLPEAIDYVARKFGFSPNQQNFEEDFNETIEDQKVFDRYDRIKDININTQEVVLQEYEGKFLNYLPRPIITPWIAEGISQESMDSHEICFDPKNQGIVIPHRDINNRLIGIRERTLIQEQAEKYGKYMPARIGGKMYNHPLSFNLYNLNFTKDNISRVQKAVVFESEKSCLKYRSYFGAENDISVAICGSSFINYQAWLLINQGAKEIIIALDRQYQQLGDAEFTKLVKNLKNIHKRYGKYVTISFMFDKTGLLDYKDSPIDKTPEIFCKLFKERINIYE